jgi:nucleoside-diphosphate-sugar epimerase
MAYSFCDQIGCHFKLVTILPGMVWGPVVVGGKTSFSHRYLLAFLNGTIKSKSYAATLPKFMQGSLNMNTFMNTGVPNFHYNIVDVRDVAFAHIQAIEKESIVGRYCFCNEPMSLEGVLNVVRRNFPQLTVPYRKVRDFVVRWSVRVQGTNMAVRNQIINDYLGKRANINIDRALEVISPIVCLSCYFTTV